MGITSSSSMENGCVKAFQNGVYNNLENPTSPLSKIQRPANFDAKSIIDQNSNTKFLHKKKTSAVSNSLKNKIQLRKSDGNEVHNQVEISIEDENLKRLTSFQQKKVNNIQTTGTILPPISSMILGNSPNVLKQSLSRPNYQSTKPIIKLNTSGSQDLETSIGENSHSSGALMQNHQLVQSSLVLMLQQKCTEMAQLADQEVMKREKVEDIFHQTQWQVNSLKEHAQTITEANKKITTDALQM